MTSNKLVDINEHNSRQSDENEDNCLIDDIPIPYFARIPKELQIGSYIKIFGKTNEDCNRFAINLMTDSKDITFHFNPRLKDGFVVRNSRIDNNWCNEEREPMAMPFEMDSNFIVIIDIREEFYRLFVNGVHFANFRHRMPYSTVTAIGIDGELQVFLIQFDRIDSEDKWDSFLCLVSSSTPQQTYEPQSHFDPKLPFVHSIAGGLRDGMVLTIIGRPLSNAKEFVINLIRRSDVKTPDIALHISVRFGKTSDQSVVVLNYRFGGEWGPEDRDCTEFPFSAEKIFDLRLMVENNRFVVIINGKNFTEFANRLYPMSDTNKIEIYGNLRLFSVGI